MCGVLFPRPLLWTVGILPFGSWLWIDKTRMPHRRQKVCEVVYPWLCCFLSSLALLVTAFCLFSCLFFPPFSSFGEPVAASQTYVFRSDFSFLVCANPSGSEKSFVGCQHLLISMGTFGDNPGIVSWIRLLKVDLHMQKSVSQGLWSHSERSQPTATSNRKH